MTASDALTNAGTWAESSTVDHLRSWNRVERLKLTSRSRLDEDPTREDPIDEVEQPPVPSLELVGISRQDGNRFGPSRDERNDVSFDGVPNRDRSDSLVGAEPCGSDAPVPEPCHQPTMLGQRLEYPPGGVDTNEGLKNTVSKRCDVLAIPDRHGCGQASLEVVDIGGG